MIDRDSLIAWVRNAAVTHKKPLVQAIYVGLAERIERGDFDVKEEE